MRVCGQKPVPLAPAHTPNAVTRRLQPVPICQEGGWEGPDTRPLPVVPTAAFRHARPVGLGEDSTRVGPASRSGDRSGARDLGGFIPEPGDKIGRYVVREEIAEGGMGLVVAAEDPELGRVVAIKLLHPDLSGRQEEQARRLLREAQAMARVSHQNLVTVFDVGTHQGQVFIAMEYVEGVTLKQWLGPKRSWQEIVETFCAAGRGLAAAHKAGLVHRDFKPANVLVGDESGPQVLDFGLVRRTGESDEPVDPDDDDDPVVREDTLAIDLTRTGSVMGTPAYMAPEQHLGQPTDARCDQFGFCVALYEALYEERPFPGEDAGRVTMAVLENERRPKPTQTEVPDRIYRLLDRGLSRDANARFESMEPLLDALMTEVGNARAPRGSGSRSPWLAVAVVAVLAAIGGAFAFSGGTEEEPIDTPGVETAAEGADDEQAGATPTSADEPSSTPKSRPTKKRPTKRGAGKTKVEKAEDRGTELPGVEEEKALPPVEPGGRGRRNARAPAW